MYQVFTPPAIRKKFMHDRTKDFESIQKILLIEDNPADARLVEILLEDSDLYHWEIDNKVRLQDGIAALKTDNYAVVLLDLTLPDSNGIETLQQLIAAVPDANVIVMTGLEAEAIGVAAIKAGAQDFLNKEELKDTQLVTKLRYSIERSNVLKRLEETQRIAHIGNWEYFLDKQYFELSGEVYRIFGYSTKGTVVSRSIFTEHLYAEDLKAVEQIIRDTVNGKSVIQDFRIKDRNGRVRYLNVQCEAARRNGNRRYESIRGIVQDITLRKNAELELLKSQKQYKAIFSQSRDAIYISDGNSLVDFNDATVELFGYPEDVLRTVPFDVFFAEKEECLELGRLIAAETSVKSFEVKLRRADGTVRECLLSMNYIESEDFTGYHGIIRDVTESKQTENLRKAKEIAEHSAKMKEQFLENVSHEMRTPMNAILGLTNLLLKKTTDEAERESYLNSIKDSSQHLLGIINDILEVSSLRENKIELKYVAFNLREMLHSLVRMIKLKAEEKSVELKVQVAPSVPAEIIGDAQRVQQILTNLLGNAVKFTEAGFIHLNVSDVEVATDNVTLRFEVRDSGIGIAADKVDMIFESFTRVFDAREKIYSGTGLGLAITKQLVQLHGGSVSVISELGKGSTFTCDIPFTKTTDEAIIEKQADEILTLDIGRPVQILLAEDHKLNQIVARKTLEKEFPNVVVTVADNGRIAIEKLAEQDFDLILMDIQMPVMDGYEATKYIREEMSPEKAKTTIFAMTAHAHISQDEKYKTYGMDDYVLKPFDPKQLFQKVVQYVLANNSKKTALTTNVNMNNKDFTDLEIDLSYMELMADGDDDMKKVMLELLFDEPAEEIQTMYVLQRQQDWDGLKKVSHKMKSTLAFVGNETLTETNKQIESIATEVSDLKKLPELIEQLDKMYQAALVKLKAEYNRLG